MLPALWACAAATERPWVAESRGAHAERVWSYRVEAGPHARELEVTAELPRGVPAVLGVDHFADPYLYALEASTGEGWHPVSRQGRHWHAPQCHELGCKLRYRYHLGRAAEQIDRFGFAAYRGGALLAPPSTWLLHPQDYTGSDTYRFSVATAEGEGFASGVWSVLDGNAYEAPAELLFQAPYSGFGRFRQERLSAGGGSIHLSVSGGKGELAISSEALGAALVRAGSVVSSYFGRFPVPELTVIVLPIAGEEILGMQLGNGGASVLLFIGRRVTDAALARDWVMVHEMFHLGFPTLSRQHLWLAEGLATYQEPIARARAGLIDEKELWRAFVTGMPKGQAGQADRGLDGSTSWGRIYWGGAMFCLLADVSIRASSDNRLSLDDAARGILRAGGDTSVRWSVEEALAVADRALGRPTLVELYREQAEATARVDLEALWRGLGVSDVDGRITFDEAAEWAHVRRAISRPRERPGSASRRPPLAATRSNAQGVQTGFAAPGVPKSPL